MKMSINLSGSNLDVLIKDGQIEIGKKHRLVSAKAIELEHDERVESISLIPFNGNLLDISTSDGWRIWITEEQRSGVFTIRRFKTGKTYTEDRQYLNNQGKWVDDLGWLSTKEDAMRIPLLVTGVTAAERPNKSFKREA